MIISRATWFCLHFVTFVYVFLQEARGSKAAPMSPEMEADDVESPMPQISQAPRRRGAISAEPITEEDVASYVKKV